MGYIKTNLDIILSVRKTIVITLSEKLYLERIMKKIKWLSFIFLLSVSNTSFTQWELRNNGISGVLIGRAIDAADSNFAVAAFINKVYKTENAGLNWINVTPLNDSGFVDVSVIDSSKIWVCTENGKILASMDGGIKWDVQFFDIHKTDFMNYIKMFDLNNGIAMGDAKDSYSPALFLKTTNGGVNWVSVNNEYLKGSFSSGLWLEVDFPDISNGYFNAAGGSDPDQVYKTTDGGQSWNPTNKGEAPELIKFFNKDIGIIFSYAGVKGVSVIRTFDGLSTADTIINANSTWSPMDAEFLPGDPSKVFHLDYARLFYSNDSGKTWQAVLVLDSSTVLRGRDIVLTDKNNGWLLCDTGEIYYISNLSSITGIEKEKNNLPGNFLLAQNYPNPFNPMTIIEYQIPASVNFSKGGTFVTLKVFDILGNIIAGLINEPQDAGYHSVEFNASSLPSGVYIYTLQVNGYTASRKMLLLK